GNVVDRIGVLRNRIVFRLLRKGTTRWGQSMKYRGTIFYWHPGTGETDEWRVTDGIVTDTRVSIDWSKGKEQGHLHADSAAGSRFRGEYKYSPSDGERRSFDLKMYSANDGEVLLFGTWVNHKSGSEGKWAFLLTPVEG
ncbi:MAG TPA: hypothetical protein VKI65_00090, partial [Gemmataceae bacterium]|nr:hypothetical protein [Gemmataceae bacterium]